MAKKKGILQKTSMVFSVISFVLAIVTAVALVLRLQSVGSDNPISASLMASTFFFVCVGVILAIMGKADLPNFKFDNSESDKDVES